MARHILSGSIVSLAILSGSIVGATAAQAATPLRDTGHTTVIAGHTNRATGRMHALGGGNGTSPSGGMHPLGSQNGSAPTGGMHPLGGGVGTSPSGGHLLQR